MYLCRCPSINGFTNVGRLRCHARPIDQRFNWLLCELTCPLMGICGRWHRPIRHQLLSFSRVRGAVCLAETPTGMEPKRADASTANLCAKSSRAEFSVAKCPASMIHMPVCSANRATWCLTSAVTKTWAPARRAVSASSEQEPPQTAARLIRSGRGPAPRIQGGLHASFRRRMNSGAEIGAG